MNTYSPLNEKIRILGRTVKKDPLPLFWTGSGVELLLNGSTLTFVLEADHSVYEEWIRVEVDDFTMIRMPLNKGETKVTVYRGLNPEETKRVQLFKEVQAMPEDPEAKLILKAIETDGELFSLPEKEMKIEFIGDSLTSGEGLAGNIRLNDWVSCVFSTKDSFSQLIAKEMNAEVRVISQSGWGAYCSWDYKTENALPLYYEKVCGVLKGGQNEALGALKNHDFSEWQPDFIFVNLGSNDKSGMLKDPENVPKAFKKAVYDFLLMLRRNNPAAEIIWACGLGKNELFGQAEAAIQEFSAANNDTKVHLLVLPGLSDFDLHELSEMLGSRNHPGPKANRCQADYIENMIRKIKEEKDV